MPDTDELTSSLISACRTTIGDDLRSVTYFTDEEFDQVYLRADLERDADLTRFVENERLGFTSQQTYGDSELGEYDFTIRAFSHGYITRVITDNHGVFVTTDELSMARFKEVAAALKELLIES